MSAPDPKQPFGKAHAARYDDQFARVAAMKDALHLCMRLVLADLGERARVLCVGAGTGAELFALAAAFPGWRFTAVEPAAAMLDICRERAADLGIADRCTFHQGYLDTLRAGEPFDAATAILVSQFLMDTGERGRFFKGIGDRLRPGGRLVSADLSSGNDAAPSPALFGVWREMMRFTGMPAAAVEQNLKGFSTSVAVLPRTEIEDLIAANGFGRPVLFVQTLFIHAWFATRT